jgi:hypothetical protein
MYIKSKGNVIAKYPYTSADFVAENPYTHTNSMNLLEVFIGTDENKKGFELHEVIQKPCPAFDGKTQKAICADVPVLEGNSWVLNWTISDKTQAELDADKMERANMVRANRNQMLSSTDWTQLADAPGDKTAWTAYRQALRDIPAQAGFPWEVTWPKRPV